MNCLSFGDGVGWGWWKSGVDLKLEVQGQGGGRCQDVDEPGGRAVKNWTLFMDVVCVSSLYVLNRLMHHVNDSPFYIILFYSSYKKSYSFLANGSFFFLKAL